ncbi:ABC transporter ATP-binding protein [Trebonia sp.]|uniref:ABC transporter ATP-binding protein n=1 Tax=Trebonia sp. TaxID=2767075 RepID=UPI00262CF4AA|nr:ABC transporter ATP-binding protein [Trebonia sp.]
MAVIEVEHLTKSYGSAKAVDDISFRVEAGEIFGILGPNGAGKTTTVECIEGLRTHDKGSVRVLGLDPHADHRELTQLLGVQLQESALPDKLFVGEALDLYSSFYENPADWRALATTLGLVTKLGTMFKNLSGGQKQRLSIALALVGNPRVAVLDELTTGLDPHARRDTWDLISAVRDSGVTVVLVTHFMEEAEHLCDRVALVDRGRIVALDTPAGLAESIQAGMTMRLVVPGTFAESLLRALPDVTSVTRRGDTLTVTGNGNVLAAVSAELAHRNVAPRQLRVEQASLEDAFLELTGRRDAANDSDQGKEG